MSYIIYRELGDYEEEFIGVAEEFSSIPLVIQDYLTERYGETGTKVVSGGGVVHPLLPSKHEVYKLSTGELASFIADIPQEPEPRKKPYWKWEQEQAHRIRTEIARSQREAKEQAKMNEFIEWVLEKEESKK